MVRTVRYSSFIVKVPFLNFKVTWLITCLLLYWPKFVRNLLYFFILCGFLFIVNLRYFFNSWCCIRDYFILNYTLWDKFLISMIIPFFKNYLLYSNPLQKFWINLWIYGIEEGPHMWPKRLPFFLFTPF